MNNNLPEARGEYIGWLLGAVLKTLFYILGIAACIKYLAGI